MKSLAAYTVPAILVLLAGCRTAAPPAKGPQEQATESFSRPEQANPDAPAVAEPTPAVPRTQRGTVANSAPTEIPSAPPFSAQGQAGGDTSWFPHELLPYISKGDREVLPYLSDPLKRHQIIAAAQQWRDYVAASDKLNGGNYGRSLDNWSLSKSTPAKQSGNR